MPRVRKSSKSAARVSADKDQNKQQSGQSVADKLAGIVAKFAAKMSADTFRQAVWEHYYEPFAAKRKGTFDGKLFAMVNAMMQAMPKDGFCRTVEAAIASAWEHNGQFRLVAEQYGKAGVFAVVEKNDKPNDVASIPFHVGPFTYKLVRTDRPIYGREGEPLNAVAVCERRLILVPHDTKPGDVEALARHEFYHCWTFHVPMPKNDEESAELHALIACQFQRDLEAAGGVDALRRLSPQAIQFGTPKKQWLADEQETVVSLAGVDYRVRLTPQIHLFNHELAPVYVSHTEKEIVVSAFGIGPAKASLHAASAVAIAANAEAGDMRRI